MTSIHSYNRIEIGEIIFTGWTRGIVRVRGVEYVKCDGRPLDTTKYPELRLHVEESDSDWIVPNGSYYNVHNEMFGTFVNVLTSTVGDIKSSTTQDLTYRKVWMPYNNGNSFMLLDEGTFDVYTAPSTVRVAAYSPVSEVWVLGGSSGNIYTATKAAPDSFTSRTNSLSSGNACAVMYNGSSGNFVAMVASSTNHLSYSDDDGVTWSTPESFGTFIRSGNCNWSGLMLSVGDNSQAKYSTDGAVWSDASALSGFGATVDYRHCCVFEDGHVMAIATDDFAYYADSVTGSGLKSTDSLPADIRQVVAVNTTAYAITTATSSGTTSSKVYRSDDYGNTWVEEDPNLRETGDIEYLAYDGSKVYVVCEENISYKSIGQDISNMYSPVIKSNVKFGNAYMRVR